MGEYEFRSWDTDYGSTEGVCFHCGETHAMGRSHQGERDPRVISEVERLRDAICPLGWDLTCDMLNTETTWEDGFMCMPAVAMLHIFINGSDQGSERFPTGQSLRVCGDELVPTGLDDRDTAAKVTAEQCLERLVELLPAHIDLLITHIREYPGYERSVQ